MKSEQRRKTCMSRSSNWKIINPGKSSAYVSLYVYTYTNVYITMLCIYIHVHCTHWLGSESLGSLIWSTQTGSLQSSTETVSLQLLPCTEAPHTSKSPEIRPTPRGFQWSL